MLGLVHLTPAAVVVQPALLERLYGVADGSTAFLLLHHRAALFCGVVVACAWAAFRPEVQRLAAVLVMLSMASFLAIYAASGSPPSLRFIALADLLGLPFLAGAMWQAFWRKPALAHDTS